jgi:hypothetical protein
LTVAMPSSMGPDQPCCASQDPAEVMLLLILCSTSQSG